MKSPKDPGLFPSKSPPKNDRIPSWSLTRGAIDANLHGNPQLLPVGSAQPAASRTQQSRNSWRCGDGRFPEKMCSPTAGNDTFGLF